jgi:arginine-tRNA-protein transferase
VSYGVMADVMTVEDYQSMMHAGWRRSGKYFYKPTMHKTCCPQYTIRMRVAEHKLSKSQKKTLKNVQKYLARSDDDASYTTEDNLRISKEFTMSAAAMLPAEAVSTPKGNTNTLTLEMDEALFTAEKFDLYRRYQIAVHKDEPDEITELGFKRFLVESCLKDTKHSTRPAACLLPSTAGSAQFTYGTFHMLYRLNGTLIAVGVVDLLPLGLSSVYVFYDNDYKQLELGKYTALKEIEFCHQHGFPYYFMGFYIHTCEKMKYKGEYKPADLLCPTTLQWYPLHTHCIDLLDKFRFTPFEPTLAAQRALCPVDVGSDATAAAGDKMDTSNTATPSSNDSSGKASPTQEGKKSNDPLAALEVYAPAFFSTSSSSTPTSTVTPDSVTTNGTTTHSAQSTAAVPTPNGTAQRRTLSQALIKVPLDIGTGQPVYLFQLQPQSIKGLRPFITEWLEETGPEIGTTVVLSFT